MITVVGFVGDSKCTKVIKLLDKADVTFRYYQQHELSTEQQTKYFNLIEDIENTSFPLIVNEEEDKLLELRQILKGDDRQ
jgi:archaellin